MPIPNSSCHMTPTRKKGSMSYEVRAMRRPMSSPSWHSCMHMVDMDLGAKSEAMCKHPSMDAGSLFQGSEEAISDSYTSKEPIGVWRMAL